MNTTNNEQREAEVVRTMREVCCAHRVAVRFDFSCEPGPDGSHRWDAWFDLAPTQRAVVRWAQRVYLISAVISCAVCLAAVFVSAPGSWWMFLPVGVALLALAANALAPRLFPPANWNALVRDLQQEIWRRNSVQVKRTRNGLKFIYGGEDADA